MIEDHKNRPINNEISVVLPIHNAEKFILRTLKSIYSNSGVYVKCHCVLDNCTDDSAQVIADYCKSVDIWGEIHVYEVEFNSIALSRNHGIEHVDSQYFCFMDHDDLVEPFCYELLLQEALRTEADVVRCAHTQKSEDNWFILHPIYARAFYAYFGIFIWNGAFKTSYIREHAIKFMEGYGEDYQFNLDIAYTAKKIGWVKQPLYHWVTGTHQTHHTRKITDYIKRLDLIWKYHKEHISTDPNSITSTIKFIMDHYWYFSDIFGISDTVYAFTRSDTVKNIIKLRSQNYRGSHIFKSYIHLPSIILLWTHYLTLRYKFTSQNTLFGLMVKLKRKIAQSPQIIWISLETLIMVPLKTIYKYVYSPIFSYYKSIQFYSYKSKKEDTIVFLLPNMDCISGGILSIFSIIQYSRKILPHRPIALHTVPGRPQVVKYTYFTNKEILFPFDSLIKQFRLGNIFMIHVPDVLVETFMQSLIREKGLPQIPYINILNQNIDLMPKVTVVEQLKQMSRRVTQTTAHEQYSTLSNARTWNIPLKHISTYVSPAAYQITNFQKKKNRIIISHDPHFIKQELFDFLNVSMMGYEKKVIFRIQYSEYFELISESKYCISLGEGLDNYFIESIFTGGIPFTLYNEEFMPARFKELDNVALHSGDFCDLVDRVIYQCETDEKYRYDLWNKNFKLLEQIYPNNLHQQKLSQFYKGEFDFYP